MQTNLLNEDLHDIVGKSVLRFATLSMNSADSIRDTNEFVDKVATSFGKSVLRFATLSMNSADSIRDTNESVTKSYHIFLSDI